jgi:hypothetical protein
VGGDSSASIAASSEQEHVNPKLAAVFLSGWNGNGRAMNGDADMGARDAEPGCGVFGMYVCSWLMAWSVLWSSPGRLLGLVLCRPSGINLMADGTTWLVVETPGQGRAGPVGLRSV